MTTPELLRVLFIVSLVAMFCGWFQMFWGVRQWMGAVWLVLGFVGALIIFAGFGEVLR